MQYDINKAIEASKKNDLKAVEQYKAWIEKAESDRVLLAQEYYKDFEEIKKRHLAFQEAFASGKTLTREFLKDYFGVRGKRIYSERTLGFDEKQDESLKNSIQKWKKLIESEKGKKSPLTRFLEMVKENGNETISDYALKNNGFADVKLGRMILSLTD